MMLKTLKPGPVPAAKSGSSRPDDQILTDLQAFAREIGLGGCTAMSKDELVESLRQHYLLQTLLTGHRPSTGFA